MSDITIYDYILNILLEKEDIVYSWGFRNPKPTYDGIIFSVSPKYDNRIVEVVLNYDELYSVFIFAANMKILIEFEGVIDWGIVNVIDKLLNNADSLKHDVYTNLKDYREM